MKYIVSIQMQDGEAWESVTGFNSKEDAEQWIDKNKTKLEDISLEAQIATLRTRKQVEVILDQQLHYGD